MKFNKAQARRSLASWKASESMGKDKKSKEASPPRASSSGRKRSERSRSPRAPAALAEEATNGFIFKQGEGKVPPALEKLTKAECEKPESAWQWRLVCSTCTHNWIPLARCQQRGSAQIRVCGPCSAQGALSPNWILREVTVGGKGKLKSDGKDKGKGKGKGKDKSKKGKSDRVEGQAVAVPQRAPPQDPLPASATAVALAVPQVQALQGVAAPLSPGQGPWGQPRHSPGVQASEASAAAAPRFSQSTATVLQLVRRLLGLGWTTARSRRTGQLFWAHSSGGTTYETPQEIIMVIVELLSVDPNFGIETRPTTTSVVLQQRMVRQQWS